MSVKVLRFNLNIISTNTKKKLTKVCRLSKIINSATLKN